MTAAQLTAIRRRLRAVRDETLGKGTQKIKPNRADDATSGVADEDAQALSEMQQVLASRRNQGATALLGRIDAAIERLASDPEIFGLCAECEEDIPWARLEAIPYATLCTACQAKHDRQRNVRRRSAHDLS